MIVRCVEYRMQERYFTLGKEYEIDDGILMSDNGLEYSGDMIYPLENPEKWRLARWYLFEVVDKEAEQTLQFTFDDFCREVG